MSPAEDLSEAQFGAQMPILGPRGLSLAYSEHRGGLPAFPMCILQQSERPMVLLPRLTRTFDQPYTRSPLLSILPTCLSHFHAPFKTHQASPPPGSFPGALCMMALSFWSCTCLAESIYHLPCTVSGLCQEAVQCRSSELAQEPQNLGFKS